MGQINKIIETFFEEPNRIYQIRGLARTLKLPRTSTAREIKNLLKKGLIEKTKKGAFIYYRANETNPFYQFQKKIYVLEAIYASNLIGYLEEKVHPRCIILFGSFAKGEYSKKSDIDLFVQSKEQHINLDKFERLLKHKINLFFEDKFENLSNELFNNIINGIKLTGYIKIK